MIVRLRNRNLTEREPKQPSPVFTAQRNAMDDHNVHHFWGISPAVDLRSLAPKKEQGDAGAPITSPEQLRILQVQELVCAAAKMPVPEDLRGRSTD